MGWIGVDLDGTLADASNLAEVFPNIGPPIPLMVSRVKAWIFDGTEVRIVTARVGERGKADDFIASQMQLIAAWCKEHLGHELPVTASKDFEMIELWDDRAIQVEPNTGIALQEKYFEVCQAVVQAMEKAGVSE